MDAELTPLEERLLDYFNFIYGTALAATGNAFEAEDIRQDVAVRVLSADSSDAINIGVEYFRTSVRNVATDAWEKNKKKYSYQAEMPERPIIHSHTTHYEVVEQIEELKAIATDAEWQAMVLFSEGWKLEEIAELLGTTLEAAAMRIKRLRTKAKKLRG